MPDKIKVRADDSMALKKVWMEDFYQPSLERYNFGPSFTMV